LYQKGAQMGINKAVISGDVIAFTSLIDEDRYKVEDACKSIISEIDKKFSGFGRVLKGDYLEYYLPNPNDALRAALSIKCFLKSVKLSQNYTNNKRAELFKIHAIRLAVGIGKISRFDPKKGVIDGEAIYLSGRIINAVSSQAKGKSSIKETFFIKTYNDDITNRLEPVFALLDNLLSKTTAKQCEVLYYKLMGLNEEAIARKMNILQPTVNQHSTSGGWNVIEKAVLNFENSINFDTDEK
jgi:hypothetical protein